MGVDTMNCNGTCTECVNDKIERLAAELDALKDENALLAEENDFYTRWFYAHASVLAAHGIGGYVSVTLSEPPQEKSDE